MKADAARLIETLQGAAPFFAPELLACTQGALAFQPSGDGLGVQKSRAAQAMAG